MLIFLSVYLHSISFIIGYNKAFISLVDKYHPVTFLMGITRVNGSRQNLIFEGAGTVYMKGSYFMKYLRMALSGRMKIYKIFLGNLLNAPIPTQTIVVTRVFSTFHIAIYLQVRYIPSLIHILADFNWICRSMGRVYDRLRIFLTQIIAEPTKSLNLN